MSHQVVNLLMNGPFNDKYLGPGSAFAFSEMNSLWSFAVGNLVSTFTFYTPF